MSRKFLPKVLVAWPLPGSSEPAPWIVKSRNVSLPCNPHTIDEYVSVEEHESAMREALTLDLSLKKAVEEADKRGLRPEIAFAVFHTKRRYSEEIAELKKKLSKAMEERPL